MLAVVRADADYVTENGDFCSEGGIGELRWTISHDVGFTWAPVRSLGIFGQPADLQMLPDGRFVCTYGYRNPPFGVRAAILELADDELTVTHEIVLRDDSVNWDCGYPSSAVRHDGTITSVYYIHASPGEVRHIAATDWAVEETEQIR